MWKVPALGTVIAHITGSRLDNSDAGIGEQGSSRQQHQDERAADN
jgi:hypothetical protein